MWTVAGFGRVHASTRDHHIARPRQLRGHLGLTQRAEAYPYAQTLAWAAPTDNRSPASSPPGPRGPTSPSSDAEWGELLFMLEGGPEGIGATGRRAKVLEDRHACITGLHRFSISGASGFGDPPCPAVDVHRLCRGSDNRDGRGAAPRPADPVPVGPGSLRRLHTGDLAWVGPCGTRTVDPGATSGEVAASLATSPTVRRPRRSCACHRGRPVFGRVPAILHRSR